MVKEADALVEAGFSVTVVSAVMNDLFYNRDKDLVNVRKWSWKYFDARPVGFTRQFRRRYTGLINKLLNSNDIFYKLTSLSDRAISRYHTQLYRIAKQIPAVLYIAHLLPALPVAYKLAQRKHALVGFDAEDFHSGQFSVESETRQLVDLTREIEARYIPRVHHMTAASAGIGEAYAQELSVQTPLTVLNCFSRKELEFPMTRSELDFERHSTELSLYWYSQTLGPDRGLEDVLKALKIVHCGVHLSLRGNWTYGYQEEFWALAKSLGVEQMITILPTVPPEELVVRAAQHDVGLALEELGTKNRKICVTNKLLVYLLSGLAVIATDTPAQRDILSQAGGPGLIFSEGDYECLARVISSIRDEPKLLAKFKSVSSLASKERFCWEYESQKLVASVKNLIIREGLSAE